MADEILGFRRDEIAAPAYGGLAMTVFVKRLGGIIMHGVTTFLNSTGRSFVDFAAVMLVQASVLILILLAVDFSIRRRVRAVVRYWLWMLVLLKLVLPTSLSLPTGLGYWFGDRLAELAPERRFTVKEPEPKPAAPVIVTTETVTFDEAVTAMPPPRDVPAQPTPPAPAKSEPAPPTPITAPAMTWQGLAFLAWLAAVAAMVLLLVQRMFLVRGLVAQSKPAGANMLEVFERCRQQMRVRRKVGLKLSPVAASPSVCGLFKSIILIPEGLAERLDSQQLKSILLHELAHIKRGDLWVSFVQTLLQIAYIYNPLLWAANAVIRKVREQSVDEMVLAAMGDEAEDYPQTLLNVSRLTFSRPALSLRLVGVVESKKALTSRIKHILSRPFPKTAKLGILGFLAMLVVAAVALPMAGPRTEGVAVPKNSLYEKAKGSKRFVVRLGPTEFSAHTVVRWDRDGSSVIKNPDGSDKKEIDLETPDFSRQSQWMDIAQVYLSPEQTKYDVIELRVFDHYMRESLYSENYPGIGYTINDSVVTVYSTGKMLPGSLDIWMRVLHRPNNKEVYLIRPAMNSTANVGGNVVRILDIAEGTYDWAGGKRTKHHAQWNESVTSVALKFDKPGKKQYQICAVGKNGDRVVPDFPHFLRPSNGWQLIEFGIAMDQISYFELRPFKGRDRFFFDNVKLPHRVGRLDSVPMMRFNINGQAGKHEEQVNPFYDVHLNVLSDTEIKGVEARAGFGTAYEFKESAESLMSIACQVAGLCVKNIRFAAYDKDGNRLSFSQKRGSGSAATTNSACYYIETKTPVEMIQTIDVYFGENADAEVLPPRIDIEKHVEDTDFAVTLPNRVRVELVGVCEHPSEGRQWWRPDGRRLDYTIRTLDPSGYASDEPGYELVFRKTGNADFKIESIKGSNVKSGLRVIEPEDLTGYRAHIKKGYKKTNIKIASPSGKWKTVVTSSGKGSVSGKIGGKTIVFAAAEQAGADVTISCSDVVGYKNATRIIAVDPKGKELIGQTRTDTGVDNVRQRTIRFSNLDLADIAEFRFQSCPYEYYTFKNVSLKPNFKTDMEVDVGENGRDERAKVLDAEGSKLEVTKPVSEKDRKALFRAAERGQAKTVRRLLDRGAGVHAGAALLKCGESVYDRAEPDATIQDYLQIAKLLIEAGANVNYRDREDATPLLRAAASLVSYKHKSVNTDFFKLLIESGADVNAACGDPKRELALTSAVRADNLELAEMLLEAGANPLAAKEWTGRDRTVLEIAREDGSREMVELLAKYAEPGLRDLKKKFEGAVKAFVEAVTAKDDEALMRVTADRYAEGVWLKRAEKIRGDYEGRYELLDEMLGVGQARGFAAVFLGRPESREQKYSKLWLMKFPDGKWRVLRFYPTNDSPEDAFKEARDAYESLDNYQKAVFDTAGRLEEVAPRIPTGMSSQMPDQGGVTVSVADGSLWLDFFGEPEGRYRAVQVLADRVKNWRGESNLGVARKLKLEDGDLKLEAEDGKATLTSPGKQYVIDAHEGKVRVQYEGKVLTADRFTFELPRLELQQEKESSGETGTGTDAEVEAKEGRGESGSEAEPGEELYEGRTIEQWMRRWDSREYDDVKEAKEVIARIGGPAVPAMVRELKKRSDYGWHAVGVLTKMGPEAAEALGVLIEAALDKELRFGDGRQSPSAYRGTVLYSLSNMTWARDRVVGVLQRIVEDDQEDDNVRASAILALRNVGKGAKPILEKLAETELSRLRDSAHGSLAELLEKEEGLSKEDYYRPLIEKDPFDASVPSYLTRIKGMINYGRPHALTQEVKQLYRDRLAKEPDAQLAWQLATIINNGLRNTGLEWAAPAEGRKGRWTREDPAESFVTLAQVLQMAFAHAGSDSGLRLKAGIALAKLRLLQGDWGAMNAMLEALGKKPIPAESRPWLPAPPLDWEKGLSQWTIADESMRSGNCGLEFTIEKDGKGLEGVHFLVKRAPEPTNVLSTTWRADTLSFAPHPLGGSRDSFGYMGNDRSLTRYAVSDESGVVRFDKLPDIPVKIEVLVPTGNFEEAGSDWELWMEVAPGKFKIAKMYGGADAVGGGWPPDVEKLREGETVHYPHLAVRPAFRLNVEDWQRIDKDDFELSWEGLDLTLIDMLKGLRYELEMSLSAPGEPHQSVEHAPVIKSAKVVTKKNDWPVGAKGVGGLRLTAGNIYMFEVRAVDKSGIVVARWPRTRVWVPWGYRESEPPFTYSPPSQDVYTTPPIYERVWWRGTYNYPGHPTENLKEKVIRFIRDCPNAFEHEHARLGKAWLDWHEGNDDGAHQQLEQLAKELPKGNVVRGTAVWLLRQINEGKRPSKRQRRLNFVPDDYADEGQGFTPVALAGGEKAGAEMHLGEARRKAKTIQELAAQAVDPRRLEARRAAWRPKLVDGISGKAYLFDRAGSYINIDDSDSLDISGNQVTISAWIKPQRIDYGQIIVAKSAATDKGWMVAIDPRRFGDGRINFYLEMQGSDGNLGSSKAVRVDTWHHVVCVYDGNEKIIYIDGKADARQSVSGDIGANDQPVRIGGSYPRFFGGKIDEVALFKRALSGEEVRRLHQNKGRPNEYEPGLVAYWSFDKDEGVTVKDGGSNHNDGELISAWSERDDKLSDPREFVKMEGHEGGGFSYSFARTYIEKDQLPLLHKMLEDANYAPYWHNVARLIGYISDDRNSVPSLLRYVQRSEGTSFKSLGGLVGKIWTLVLIGKIGGPQAEAALRDAVTEEGAARLAKAWIDGELLPGNAFWGSKKGVIIYIRSCAASGLILTRKPENIRIVTQMYEEYKQEVLGGIKDNERLAMELTESLAINDFISDNNDSVEAYLSLTIETLSEGLGPYIRKRLKELNLLP